MPRLDREEYEKRLEASERKRASLQKTLARRNAEEDTLLWTIADLMTLLLIFFILFYSQTLNQGASAKNHVEIQPAVVRLQKAAFTREGSKTKSPPEIQGSLALSSTMSGETVRRDPLLEELRRQVLGAVEDEDKTGAFSVHWDQRRLVLVLGERITFNVGAAELRESFLPTLKRIAGLIASKNGYQVVVSGHTDDTPIHNASFPSNWELSAIRAVNVARFLIKHGVDPRRVSIRGYSEYRPLYENTLPENKQANRRVEITLIREKASFL